MSDTSEPVLDDGLPDETPAPDPVAGQHFSTVANAAATANLPFAEHLKVQSSLKWIADSLGLQVSYQ